MYTKANATTEIRDENVAISEMWKCMTHEKVSNQNYQFFDLRILSLLKKINWSS